MDETTALLRDPKMSSRAWTSATLRRVAAGAAVAAVATLGVLSSPEVTRAVKSSLGLTAGQTRYLLRTRCMSDDVKAANPGFFREGTSVSGAMLVRHNLGSDSFFPAYEAGMQMTPLTFDITGYEWDWEEGRFFIDLPTGTLDNEWGFALVNTEGEVFYEVGSGADAPLWGQTCRDLVRWDSPTDQWFNRLMSFEATDKIEYVFGSCDTTCPEREFNDWTDEQRRQITEQVKENTPNEVGSEFTMYGYAGDGVCQFDILVPGHESATDQYSQNRIMHWAPSDSRGYVHTNARKDHHWSGEKNWPGGWPFGPVNDPSSRQEWRVKILLKETTLESSACLSWTDDSTCVVKSNEPYEFGYRPSDISGIQTAQGYAENYLPSDGNCDFYAKYPGAQKNPDF
jgi:hypothetical protein